MRLTLDVDRVARRFLADVIADPKTTLVKFRERVDEFCKREAFAKEQLPKLKRMIEMIETGTSNVREPGESQDLSQILMKGNSERYDTKWEIKGGYWYKRMRVPGQVLFWAILQQYALPPQLQRAIEAANKFWSKERTVARFKSMGGTYDEDVEVLTQYLKIVGELQKQLANAEAAIVKGKLHSDPEQAGKTKFPAGAFTVVNTGGFDDEEMRKSVEIVTMAEKAMTSHGLGKVCYGDVLISKTITTKKTVAAFYLVSSDEMFVRADLPADSEHVRIVCHELTHRLEHKFLSSKRNAIVALYREINTHSMVSVHYEDFPKKGESITWDGKPCVVIDLDFRKQIVKVQPVDEPGTPVSYSYYPLPLALFNKLKGKSTPVATMHFVTGYAKKGGPSENFAEMVSFYVLGKLPEAQTKPLEEILFG